MKTRIKASRVKKDNLGLNLSVTKMTVFILTVSLIALSAGTSLARARGENGPPPEAYDACEGKVEGDAAQFEDHRGETVTGICVEEGARLVLRPDRPVKSSGGRHHGPPSEAYDACEGKVEGDAAQFEDPRGETVTGTCEEEGDRLVLRPTRLKSNSD